MTCDKVLEYLFAFLGNELEPGLSIDVQTHLEHCPACAREAEVERAVRRGLEGALCTGGAPELEEEALVRSLAASNPRRPARRTSLAWFLGSALSAAAAIAMIVHLRPAHTREGFVDLVAQEAVEFLEHIGPVQLTTSEISVLTDWLRAQTSLPVTVADVSASGWRVIGGRRCSLDGLPAAFALFERGGGVASVIAVSEAHADMGNLKREPCGDEVHWVGRCKGRNIVANKRGGLVYFAVSDLPALELHELVMEPHR
jgi:anti-sigma factor RsiW